MSAVTLKRTDQARRISRFYLLAVQPELFGDWSLVREWGRIGQPGQTRIVVGGKDSCKKPTLPQTGAETGRIAP